MSTEKPAPRRKRATTKPMWNVTAERAVSRQLAAVTDESWGDVPDAAPVAKPAAKPAAVVAKAATAPVKPAPAEAKPAPVVAPVAKAAAPIAAATPAATPAPAPARPKLGSVTSIAASMSGRVTRPIETAKTVPMKVEAKPAPAPVKVEAKPAPAPVKVEAKPAAPAAKPAAPAAKVEHKPLAPLRPIESRPLPALRSLAPLKPIEAKPLPALRPLGTKPVEVQKPIEAPKPAPIAVKPIEAAKPIETPKPELKKPIAPLKPILAAELPPLPAVKLPGMPPARRLAEGSIAPPTSQSQSSASKPLPSLFSVIDRKKQVASVPAAAPRALDLSRPKVAARVVAASITAATPLAMGSTVQKMPAPEPQVPSVMVAREAVENDEPDYIQLSSDDLIEDVVPELLSIPDFVPAEAATLPAPLPPAPRVGLGSAASFSDLEESFFAAGEQLDTGEQDALEPESFDDLPPVERLGFWSRLRAGASARE